MTTQNRNNEAKNIDKAMSKFFKSAGTLREDAHSIMVNLVWFGLKYNDYTKTVQFLNQAVSVKFLNSSAISLWFKEVGGLKYEFDKKSQTFSSVGRQKIFDFGKDYVQKCKDTPFWTLAGIEHKEIKLAADLDALFSSTLDRLALNMLAGKFTSEDVAAYMENFGSKLNEAAKKDSVKTKLATYLEQVEAKKTAESSENTGSLESALMA